MSEWWEQDKEEKENKEICSFRQNPMEGMLSLILEISESILIRGKEMELTYSHTSQSIVDKDPEVRMGGYKLLGTFGFLTPWIQQL